MDLVLDVMTVSGSLHRLHTRDEGIALLRAAGDSATFLMKDIEILFIAPRI